MKTIIAIFSLSLVATLLAAQDVMPSKLKIGLYANGGISSLVQGMGMNMNMYGYGGMYGSNITMYNYISSVGGGVSLTVPFHQRW